MEILERIWELIGEFFSSLLRGFERGVTSLFGSSNARFVKRLQGKVDQINALESKYEALSDEELKHQTALFRDRLAEGETLDDILIEAFAVCREAGKRYLGMRHYDVQMIGGMVLHSGTIAEMVTGEGKTLVATLPAYLNAIEGKGVHVVTVNDYLARRDMEWMAPLYMGLGLTVGAIQSDMDVDSRQKAYDCDITYGTNNEFGFDYLRDNMRPAARGDDRYAKRLQQSQGTLNYAIIDEVDNILIDEARTPLIISGPAHDNVRKYADADQVARQLKKQEHFTVNEKDHSCNLTDEGVRAAEKLAGVESFYTAGNMEWPHLIDNALKAHFLYKRDVNYVIKEGRIIIVDEFTGRLMEGRQWSDGLHQAVEAKEGVRIKEESQTLATVTLQNFFKLYKKLCGMTGTAMTEANEFWKIYKLDVVAIPTNRGLQRIEYPDVIYRSEREKFLAVAEDIERLNKWDVLVNKKGEEVWGTIQRETDGEVEFVAQGSKEKQKIARDQISEVQKKGRPVLVGTVSIEKSERLSELLNKRGIQHEVLNAKFHKREAEIVAQAGRLGAVTIATNMAGRGTDIVLGGNPETMAWARLQDKYETRLDVPNDEWDELVEEIDKTEKMSEVGEYVRDIGGLYVIGTERHDARRIDLQLRGRTGRQGDPGSSRFYLSLEDDLMRIFAGPWVKSILERLGMQEGERIESRMVTRRIEAAQRKVEERNFEIRKNLLEYDEVMDEQRKRVYGYRQRILDGESCRELITKMVREQVAHQIGVFTHRDYAVDVYAAWAGSQLSCQLDGRDFRGMDAKDAAEYARDVAERLTESAVLDSIEESLPEAEDPSEWNWESLAKTLHGRWGLNVRDRDLKKIGRDDLAEYLIQEVHKSIQKVDLSAGEVYLKEDFVARTVQAWANAKFKLDLELEEIQQLELDALEDFIVQKALGAYDEREAEFPVMLGMMKFIQGDQLDREGLVDWINHRLGEVSLDDLKSKQRDEIVATLIEVSRGNQSESRQARVEMDAKLEAFFKQYSGPSVRPDDRLQEIVAWTNQTFKSELDADKLCQLEEERLKQALLSAIDDRFHPEFRRLERQVLLELVDAAWKEHLLVMDHLRSSVGLKGYAQMDPKVEYKREGMRLFEQMWTALAERSTDLMYRVEQLDDGFVGSTWVETAARHDQAQSTSEIAQQQEDAISASQGSGARVDPIRNRGPRVGRNDPCPCGSGRKYKVCCMRNQGAA